MGLIINPGFVDAVHAAIRAHQQARPAIIKPLFLDPSSKAAADIERGNKLFLAGNIKEAAKAYDEAAEKDQDSPIPWLNGALAAKELGKFGVAKISATTAYKMGDNSARGKVIGAEVDLARNNIDNAKSKLGQALFADPLDSYGLLGMAKVNMMQARLREGERFMWQGYRGGTAVVLDSKLATEQNLGYSAGSREGNVQGSLQTANDISSSLEAGYIDQVVGAADALQQLTKFNFAFDTPFGVLAGNHRALLSDRPGASDPNMLLPATPGSKLDFKHTMVGLQNRTGNWTWHANYREELSSLKPGAFAGFANDNRMHQWILETRYDSGPWMSGVGYSRVSKASTASPAIEPLEAIFPQGTTNLYNGYLVHRSKLNNNISLTSGAIYTSAGGTSQAGVTAQLAVRLMGNKYIKIGVKPGVNRVGTNLGPINDMSSVLQDNPVDRTFGSALEFNRDGALPSLNGRLQNAFLSLPIFQSTFGSMVVNAFQNTFSNYNFIGSDPVTSNTLALSPVTKGKVSGVGVESTINISNSMSFRLAANAQSSNGTYTAPTLSLSSGAPQSTKVSQLPNIPNFAASASFDWSTPNLSLALTGNYAGPRWAAVTNKGNNPGIPPGTYVTQTNSALSLDAHMSLSLGTNGTFNVSLLNLTNSNFYPGFRSSRQIMIGFSSKQ